MALILLFRFIVSRNYALYALSRTHDGRDQGAHCHEAQVQVESMYALDTFLEVLLTLSLPFKLSGQLSSYLVSSVEATKPLGRTRFCFGLL